MKRIITLALGIVLIFACLPIATICVNAEQTELLTGGEWLNGFRTPSKDDKTIAAIRTDTNACKRRAYYSKLIDVTEGKEYTFSFKGRVGDGIKVLQLKNDGTSIVSNINYWVGREDTDPTDTQINYIETSFTTTITPAPGTAKIGFSLFHQYDGDGVYNSNPLGITFDYQRIINDVSSGTITYSFKGDVTTSGVDLAVTANMKSGAAIRLTNGNGLRFITAFDADKIAELQGLGATVELGTLIAPKDLLGENDLTFDLDSSNYVNVKYEAIGENGAYSWHKDVAGQIAGSIVGIKESGTTFSAENGNIARDFVGRGYVKVTFGDETVITYASYASGDIANNTRSLASVAQALKDDTAKYDALDSDVKSLVDNWASKLPTQSNE